MRSMFYCIDGHTAGNPVRLLIAGMPHLRGSTMSALRQDFIDRFDWIRNGLMFEPRGHDIMSGGIVYPPLRADCDASILFMETSGVLPMCGHGSIGMITFALEHGLIRPRREGELRIEVPAGILDVRYVRSGTKVTSVTFTNVPSFLYAADVEIDDEVLGRIRVDVAYGGNFYAIIEPQGRYEGIDALGARGILSLSPRVRAAVEAKVAPVHPLDPSIRGVSHVMWADAPGPTSGRGAVFYAEKAIDRSPCGTGTSARIAQLYARGKLAAGDRFEHRSYIDSLFIGRITDVVRVGDREAIRPSIEGSAHVTGYNQLWIDPAEPFPEGFLVS